VTSSVYLRSTRGGGKEPDWEVGPGLSFRSSSVDNLEWVWASHILLGFKSPYH
jgi:hypothetical protein